MEKLQEQVDKCGTRRGESLLASCLDCLAVWEAAYGYLGRWHRLCKKGNRSFYSKLMWRYWESWVMIRLHLVSLISPPPPYRSQSNLSQSNLSQSNLVPMERSFQGESNNVSFKKFGEELAKDIRYYWEMNWLTQIQNIGAFLFRLAARCTSPLHIKCSPSILSHFWQGLECFGG